MDLPTLTDDVVDSHRDAIEAARVSQLCAKAAGRRLIETRRSLGVKNWNAWLRGDSPPSKSAVNHYLHRGGALPPCPDATTI